MSGLYSFAVVCAVTFALFEVAASGESGSRIGGWLGLRSELAVAVKHPILRLLLLAAAGGALGGAINALRALPYAA